VTAPWTPPTLRAEPCEVVITPQQANVLSGICCGHTNRQIGTRLRISEHTVKCHVRALYAALGSRDRAHAVALVLSGQVQVQVLTNPYRRKAA
jgi:DNA-binding NarL/FixJ family response regulator